MHTTHPEPTIRSSTTARAAALLVLLLVLTACGGDDADTATAEVAATTDTSAEEAAPAVGDAAAGGAVAVTAVDYAFENLPAEIEAGSELMLQGAADAEPHELVLFRLEDGDERPPMEILSGGPEGPPPGEFAGVLIAPPGGAPGFAPEGPVIVSDPGRYLAVCFFPVGTTPEAFAELAASEGNSEDLPQTGPPHFTQGMVADFAVS